MAWQTKVTSQHKQVYMSRSGKPKHMSRCTQLSLVIINYHCTQVPVCLQSLVTGVDMEDLGVRSCSASFKNAPVEQPDFPGHLKQYVKVTVV